MTLAAEISEEAIEEATKAYWRCEPRKPNTTWETEDPEYKEHLRKKIRIVFSAATPYMQRVVSSEEGLLPGTVLQDRTGDVVKLMDNGEWWGTDQDEHTFVYFPATVLVEGTEPD